MTRCQTVTASQTFPFPGIAPELLPPGDEDEDRDEGGRHDVVGDGEAPPLSRLGRARRHVLSNALAEEVGSRQPTARAETSSGLERHVASRAGAQERLPTAGARRSRRVVQCATFGADHAADLIAYGRDVRQHASAELADGRARQQAALAACALSEGGLVVILHDRPLLKMAHGQTSSSPSARALAPRGRGPRSQFPRTASARSMTTRAERCAARAT